MLSLVRRLVALFHLRTHVIPRMNYDEILFAIPGRVVAGMDVVRKIESVGSNSGATSATVTIADCGEVKTKGA